MAVSKWDRDIIENQIPRKSRFDSVPKMVDANPIFSSHSTNTFVDPLSFPAPYFNVDRLVSTEPRVKIQSRGGPVRMKVKLPNFFSEVIQVVWEKKYHSVKMNL
eukprot:CAMPEP_0175166958 /NCGR_PEP_ID=MMETSP0087-20121206/28030_1 /TAXON_ID=136419 /ORGANISM="Unknown Unknown, Strain D1" /LENGTH=103 /DNA_ID=CAMNT_0016456703 /DNA_START=292 /DNA_END=599 /DNA_ORIENTATION=+